MQQFAAMSVLADTVRINLQSGTTIEAVDTDLDSEPGLERPFLAKSAGVLILPFMPLDPGTTLGPYEITSALGAGGMGEVYRAKDTRLGRDVAIKILPKEMSTDPARKQRFEREAKIISGLNHPNICVLHDIGHQDGIEPGLWLSAVTIVFGTITELLESYVFVHVPHGTCAPQRS